MPIDVLDFPSALTKAESLGGKRHLLLGNGFSIDWKPGIFKYGSLLERADFSKLSADHVALFSSLATNDFEKVMTALKAAATLAEVYSTSDKSLAEKMLQDAEYLKDILVNTIAQNHPELPSEVTEAEYSFCRRFLTNFSLGNIYTLNYDLLLYWVLMHAQTIKCDDGFRKAEDQDDFVEWNSFNSQNIYYLHGALHLFDHGYTLEKYTWINTGMRLMDQIRSALDQDKFPLVVTEGESEQKLARITHSGYLHKGLRSFESITGSLFIHGHSLSENDDHFLDLIPKTKIKNLFVSLFNPTKLYQHRKKIEKLELLQQKRSNIFSKPADKQKYKLDIYYYDAESARVWR